MEPVGLDFGSTVNYLQDLTVSSDGSNLLDIIDQNIPGYHRVTKTDPFQDPTEDEPLCMHRYQLMTSAGGGGPCVTTDVCETSSLDLSPTIDEDFQKMYNDWQQHMGFLQTPTLDDFVSEFLCNLSEKGSEDEELVVDEVVSQSLVEPSCTDVPLDVDPDTFKTEFGVTLDEVEEVVAELDGSIFINDSIFSSELSSTLPIENVTSEDGNDPSCDGDTKQVIPEEKNKVDNKVEVKEEEVNKEVKLPAGSIVLAVVNEEGSLVPYIDVETVPEKTPVLEAGDVDSLLAQFEATEAVNKSDGKSSQKNNLKKIDESKPANDKKIESGNPATTTLSSLNSSPPVRTTQTPPTSLNIKDSLPKDFIEKIKASNKRKSTQMLTEPIAVHKGRVVKKSETSTQRLKGSKTPSNQTKQQKPADLRVPPPLDHDYCSIQEKKKKGKLGKGSTSPTSNTAKSATKNKDGIYNKLPDYYTVLPKPNEKNSSSGSDDGHDDVGKKDSGVESGNVSDASEETEEQRKEGQDSKDGCINNLDVYSKLPAYVTDIGNTKPKIISEEEEKDIDTRKEKEKVSEQIETKKIKRKLNLSEYRQRIKSTQSSRCPSPSAVSSTETVNILQVAELVKKMENSKSVEDNIKDTKPGKNIIAETTEEDMEEGELKGDSDPEECLKADAKQLHNDSSVINQTENNASSVMNPVPHHTTNAPHSQSKIMPSAYSNITPSLPHDIQGSGPGGQWEYSPSRSKRRRWSSSSRSPSRTRSPRHTSRRHRSSRGRRRRIRKSSRSSQSPRGSSWRCWSKSLSRSRSRSYSRSRSRSRPKSRDSSLSSNCSSTASRSRSRSRSRSSRRRERWIYSRRKSHRDNRRSRSGSRSSHRGSSRITRSRSPHWMPRTLPGGHEDRRRQVEERRVIYVGRIEEGTTKAELRSRFERYGVIVDISVHFREHGDNYGFVTFKNREEAYQAVEHGNDDKTLPKYDLCFGGRRAFCKVQYSDLDAQSMEKEFHEEGPVQNNTVSSGGSMDFDALLRAAMKRCVR